MFVRALTALAALTLAMVYVIPTAAQASDRTVIDYTAAVLAGAKTPFKQCFDLANGPVSVRLSPPDPSAAAIRARFGRQGAETAIAVDSQVHALTLPAGTACLELENTTAVPPGASPAAVEQATATVAVEVRTTGSASPPASADEKILLDARHSTTQGSFCIRLPEGVLSAATSLDRALPNNDYDVYSINTRPASKINMQAAVTGSQQPPATTIATVRQGTYCGEAVRSFSDSTGSHTAPLESVDVRLAWRPAGNDLFTAFPPKAHSNYTPEDVPSGLPFATIDEAIAAAPPGGTPLEASPVPVLLLPDTQAAFLTGLTQTVVGGPIFTDAGQVDGYSLEFIDGVGIGASGVKVEGSSGKALAEAFLASPATDQSAYAVICPEANRCAWRYTLPQSQGQDIGIEDYLLTVHGLPAVVTSQSTFNNLEWRVSWYDPSVDASYAVHLEGRPAGALGSVVDAPLDRRRDSANKLVQLAESLVPWPAPADGGPTT